MNRKHKIIFFCMIFVASKSFSQTGATNSSFLLLLQKPADTTFHTNPFVKKINPKTVTTTSFSPVITADYYVNHLGFFCVQEIKFEKLTKVPFRFRLGSIEDCDRMEGKFKKR